MIDTNDNTTYGAVIQRFVNDYENKDNGALISEVYRFMSKSYRNEYFYQNTLLNKLLLGKHSINTTTALTQIPISKSKADFILINGKAVVYEIKTELDTFERLDTQLRDYFKAFNHVCVVTSDSQYDRAASLLQNTPVGIYALTPQNTISSKLRKELDDLYHNLALRQGLSDSASIILYALYLLGDGCLQRDICDLSYISKQTINSSIRRLEQDGYLYLQPEIGRAHV